MLSYLMKDRWYMVRLVDDDMLWSDMYMVVARNIVIAVLLYALFAMVITFIFMRHLKTHRLSYAKSGFLVNMSREIKTAMTDMLGLSSIVMKEVRGDTLKDYVKNIQNAGEGVLSLVSDVLDVSKIESGKMSLVSMEYDVFAVLSDCYSENFPKASAKNLRFTLECNPDIPTSMWGDETRIRQILNNLLSNAIKFTEVGEVSLSVGFEHLPPIGNLKSDDYVMLKFIVKDTGVGISDDELDSIFSRYIPKAKKYEEQIEGAGIGLSLTKALVEKCGGQISVSSRVGEGSAFVVKIPQLVMNMDPIGDFSLKYRTASRKNDDLSELFIAPDARVLIVDDMEINLKVLRGFLKGSKVQVDVALSGMQCLKLVQSKRYDLIFLDQRMPVMDGMETYRKMKALGDYANKDTPVVVLTSEGSVKSRESFLSEGFADYLPKPIRERDLLRALKWYLPKQLVLGSDDLDYASSESGKQFDGIVDEDTIEDGGIELHSVTTLNPYEKMEPFRDILDVKAGLEYCADDSGIYLEMLQEYVQSTLSRSVDISFKNDDWDNYRFYMHVLSDASSAIGAVSMAKQFSDLEMACRESRMNFVRANHELAMITHTELIFNIQKGLEK